MNTYVKLRFQRYLLPLSGWSMKYLSKCNLFKHTCSWRDKLTGLPLFSCAENWEDLRKNYKYFWDLSKPCTKFEENWGDFTHACSSRHRRGIIFQPSSGNRSQISVLTELRLTRKSETSIRFVEIIFLLGYW